MPLRVSLRMVCHTVLPEGRIVDVEANPLRNQPCPKWCLWGEEFGSNYQYIWMLGIHDASMQRRRKDTLKWRLIQHQRRLVVTCAAEAEVINDMVTSGVEGRLSSEEQMSVYMVAGYVAFKHLELRGTHLPSDMTAYFDHINRGKLSTPSDSLLHLVLLAMIFFIKTEAGNCRKRLCNLFP